MGNFRFRQLGEIDGLAEKGAPLIRPGLAGDNIHHGSFPGAVRADDAAKFPGVDGERQVVQSLETVETDGNTFQVEDGAMGNIDDTGRVGMTQTGHFTAMISADFQ